MLKINDKAPDFSLSNVDGSIIKLSDLKGKKIVLYFYPKDNTPGCTKEACSFRDVYDEILEKGSIVIGISTDNMASHQKFRDKFSLPFYLLSDADHGVSEMYGAWGEKKLYGKTFMGIKRMTYVIDESQRIIQVFPKVSPEKHGNEILELL